MSFTAPNAEPAILNIAPGPVYVQIDKAILPTLTYDESGNIWSDFNGMYRVPQVVTETTETPLEVVKQRALTALAIWLAAEERAAPPTPTGEPR
jgi:hypothetical protein